MGTKVKVRQDFEQTPASALPPPLESCIIGPLNRSIVKAVAGLYDTLDSGATCHALPSAGVNTIPNVSYFSDAYCDPVFYNARYPDLTGDAETHLSNIFDNREAYVKFRENTDFNPNVNWAAGGWASSGSYATLHQRIVPGSVIIARKAKSTMSLGATVTYILASQMPSNLDTLTPGPGNDPAPAHLPGNGSFRADAIIAGTFTMTDPNTGFLVYQKGVDYEVYYDFDGNPAGGSTKWAIEILEGSQIALGTTVQIEFEGKLPYAFGDELDMEVDYQNGVITNVSGSAIHEPIVYYSFLPVVSVAAFMRDRQSSQIVQLNPGDYTVKDVDGDGVMKVCVRPGIQGPLMTRSGFQLDPSYIKSGNYLCGTKVEEFNVGGPCGNEPEADTIRFCAKHQNDAADYVNVVLSPAGLMDAQTVCDKINQTATISDYIYAYESNGRVCIRLAEGADDDDIPTSIDMRGADCYVEIQAVARDFAPVLGLAHGKICGKTQYQLTDSSADFKDRQDSLGNILGSIVLDDAENRYRIDQVVSNSVIIVTQVDTLGVDVCGYSNVVVPAELLPYKVYFSAWSSEILVTYTAARTDLVGKLIEVTNGGEALVSALSEDGTQDNFSAGPENPLAYALAKFYFTNTTRSCLVVPTAGTSLAAWQDAVETLELSERPHCLIPLTASQDACAAISEHVMEMSDPDQTYEPQTRVAVFTNILEDAKVITDLANDAAEIRASFNPPARAYTSDVIDPTNFVAATGKAKIFILEDGDGTTNVNFVTDGVAVGDRVRIHYGANRGDWRVTRVITAAPGNRSWKLECAAISPAQWFQWDTEHSNQPTASQNTDPDWYSTSINQNGLVAYTIWRPLTKTEHASQIKQIGSGYRAKPYPYRITTTWGPLFVDDSTPDGRSATLPGYFLNAALAGGCATAPVQQGFTNYAFNGTNQVLYSKGHFNNKQLDDIEAGGVWVWQVRPGDTYYHSRQQFTVTGYLPTESLSSQFHIIRIADRMHRRLWSSLIGFTGIYNITPENIAVFRMVMDAAIDAAKKSNYARVGPEILDGYVVKLECSKTTPRTLIGVTRIIPPESVDVFDITNQVRRG